MRDAGHVLHRDRHRTRALAVALLGRVGELALRVGVKASLPAFSTAGLSAAGRLRRRSPAGPCPARACPPSRPRRRRCRRASRPRRGRSAWRPSGLGLRTGLRRPPDRAAPLRLRRSLAEGLIEIGPDDALGVGARERVAGAALGDERLLAVDHVGVVAALDRAAGRAERDAGERQAPPARAAPEPRAGAPSATVRGGNCDKLMGGGTLSEAGGCRRRSAPRGARSGRLQAVEFAAARPRSPRARHPSHDQRSRTVATSPARVRARSARSAGARPPGAARGPRTARRRSGRTASPRPARAARAASASLTSAAPSGPR